MLTKKEFNKYRKENLYKSLYNNNDNGFAMFSSSKREFEKKDNSWKKIYLKINKYSKLSNHKKEIAGIDYSKELEVFKKYKKREISIVISFDYQNKVKETKVISLGNGSSVSCLDTFKYIVNTSDAYKIIVVHNHPYCICAMPSYPDLEQREKMAKIIKVFGKELLDYCVYTELDYYSYKQDKNKMQKLEKYRAYIKDREKRKKDYLKKNKKNKRRKRT